MRTRPDLDTPAGARDFQRFLIGKPRDIRAVVMNASLDDTSKSFDTVHPSGHILVCSCRGGYMHSVPAE